MMYNDFRITKCPNIIANKLSSSIAMTTYNGERFLIEQLKSLNNQTRKPDEVVICDDGSKDNTVALIKKFIENNDLHTSWKLVVNEINKGYTLNYLDCAAMTKGDVIFFCDQDDIWDNIKIEKMMYEFENNHSITAMGCSISCIDSEGNKNNNAINKMRMGKGGIDQISFARQARDNVSVGLTLAVRREVLGYLAPIIRRYNLPFDTPIGLFTSVTGGYYRLYQPLVYRRVHENNISTPKYTLKSRLKNVDSHILGRQMHVDLMKVCLECNESILNDMNKQNLRNTISAYEQSILNIKHGKIFPLFLEIFSRNPMSNRIIAVVNFLCATFGKKPEVIAPEDHFLNSTSKK